MAQLHLWTTRPTLHLQEVSGNTEKFNFSMSFSEKENAEMMNGGFYQGFFQTICDTYKVLPSELEDCWQLEFVIKKVIWKNQTSPSINIIQKTRAYSFIWEPEPKINSGNITDTLMMSYQQ